MRDLYGAFTLPDTKTDTDTDIMGTEPNGNTFHTVLGNRFLLVLVSDTVNTLLHTQNREQQSALTFEIWY